MDSKGLFSSRADLSTDSLEAQASSKDSRIPDILAITRYLQMETEHPVYTSEKPLGRLTNGIIPTSGGGYVYRKEDSAVEVPVSSGYRVEQRRGPRHEADRGVRIAGGRVGEVIAADSDQFSTSEGSTLPLAYWPHFGGT